jgi:hypothetical protein
MTFDLKRMLESKKALRRKLAQLPVAKKLAMLDTLRDALLRSAGLPVTCVIPPCMRSRKNTGPDQTRKKAQRADVSRMRRKGSGGYRTAAERH